MLLFHAIRIPIVHTDLSYYYYCFLIVLMFPIYKDDGFVDGISLSMSDNDTENKMFPTVFRWEGGGKQVFVSGTFSEWKPIPMVQRYFHVYCLNNNVINITLIVQSRIIVCTYLFHNSSS